MSNTESLLSPSKELAGVLHFVVMWTKEGHKSKPSWNDGTLEFHIRNKSYILKDENSYKVKAGFLNQDRLYQSGEINLGTPYLITIESEEKMTYTDISSILPKNRKAYFPPSSNGGNQLETPVTSEVANKLDCRNTKKTSTKGIIAPPHLHLSNSTNIHGSNVFKSPLDSSSNRQPIYSSRPVSSSSSRSSTKITTPKSKVTPSKSNVALYVLDSTSTGATAPYIPPLPKTAQYNAIPNNSNQALDSKMPQRSTPPDLSALSMPIFNHQENSSKTQNRMRIAKKPLYEIHSTSPNKSLNKLTSPSRGQSSFDIDFGSSDMEFGSSLEVEIEQTHQEKATSKSNKLKSPKAFLKNANRSQSSDSNLGCEDHLIDLNLGKVSYNKFAENDPERDLKLAVKQKELFSVVTPVSNTTRNDISSKNENEVAELSFSKNQDKKVMLSISTTPESLVLLNKRPSATVISAENKNDSDIFKSVFPTRSGGKLLSLSSRSMLNLPKSKKSFIQKPTLNQHNRKLETLKDDSEDEYRNGSNSESLNFDKKFSKRETTLDDKHKHMHDLKKIPTTVQNDLDLGKPYHLKGPPSRNNDFTSPLDLISDDDIEVLDQCQADISTKLNLKRRTDVSVAEISKRTKISNPQFTCDSPTIEDDSNQTIKSQKKFKLNKESLGVAYSPPKQSSHKDLSSFAFENLDMNERVHLPSHITNDTDLNISNTTIPDSIIGFKKNQPQSTLKTNLGDTLDDNHLEKNTDKAAELSSQKHVQQYPSSFDEAFELNSNDYMPEKNGQPTLSFLPTKSPEFEFDDKPSLDLDLENLSQLDMHYDFIRKCDVISERKTSPEPAAELIQASSELIENDPFSEPEKSLFNVNRQADDKLKTDVAIQKEWDREELPNSDKDFKITASFEMPPPTNVKRNLPASHSTKSDDFEEGQQSDSLLDISFELSQAIDEIEMTLSQQNLNMASENSVAKLIPGTNTDQVVSANQTTLNTLPTFFNITNALVFPSHNKMPAYKNPLRQSDKKSGRNYKAPANPAFSLVSRNKQTPVIITEFGPWTPETLELLDWRPPNLSYPPKNQKFF